LTGDKSAHNIRNMVPSDSYRHADDAALRFLFSDVQYLKGIGPSKAKVLKEHNISNVFDLFFYTPRKYLDHSRMVPMSHLEEGQTMTLIGTVSSYGYKYGRRRRYIVNIHDDTGHISLVWFSGYKYLENMFNEGDVLSVTGKIGFYDSFQIAHPEFEIISGAEDEPIHTLRIIPVYSETALLKKVKLHSRGLRRVIKHALDKLSAIPCETLPESIRTKYKLMGLREAIAQVHFPDSFEAKDNGLNRLAFEELFYLELLLAARHSNRTTEEPGISFPPPKKMGRALLDNLKFELTGGQKKALNEIYADMAKPHPMNRLLQGDVGCGKTVVAVLTMLGAVEAGYQAAIMAPTEILAEQHGIAIGRLLDGLGLKIAIFTGSTTGKERQALLGKIKSGKIDIIIGTHTLIQSSMAFAKLGLIVIDEQHKFGVAQRGILKQKGIYPDTLVMTATPIPRTLAMTAYGDLDISVINEMPPGRVPIQTSFVPLEKRNKMYGFIKEQVENGRQVYIVYPLVEESEKLDLKAAKESYASFKDGAFRDIPIALLHGKMKGRDKTKTMQDFQARKTSVIVATTVIEVGLDVPNANIMVIEHVERFGLSQLHQLRGRIGRGTHKSYCFLLSDTRLSQEAEARVKALCATNDGFKIAEVDMAIRGPGEIMGTRQHGLPELKVARLTDAEALTNARQSAFEIIAEDDKLIGPGNRLLRKVLIERYGDKIKYSRIA
jgi:ATP-dependent DNA helicase RecG